MNILHICSYYNTSALYKHLIKSIHDVDNEINQITYIPMAKGSDICPDDHGTVRNKTKNYDRVNHIYTEPFNRRDRYVFSYKNNKIFKDLKRNVDLNKIDLIHAHSLFVNGNVAYNINKIYGTEYIVAVRATDVEMFFKKMIHLRNRGINILRNAKKIIFISHHLKDNVINNYIPKKYKQEIEYKSIVLPNGIDEFWFENNGNIDIQTFKDKKYLRLSYIGTLHKRKNVDKIIQVFEHLNDNGIKTKLSIIGGGPDKEEIYKLIEENKYSELCKISTWSNDRIELKNEYSMCDIFIMPSIKETFGISYLEAISQGKPIIYTKNDGIDGYFEDGEVGYSVDPYDIKYIVKCINLITESYEKICNNCIVKSREFHWDEIAKQYISIYDSK